MPDTTLGETIMLKKLSIFILLCLLLSLNVSCEWLTGDGTASPRLSMFIGLDISGSFLHTKYFDDSINLKSIITN